MRRPIPILLLASVVGTAPLGAQRATGWIQAEGFYHGVTGDFGDWKGGALRLMAPAGRSSIVHAELIAQEAFRDTGVWGSLGLRQQLGPSWFAMASAGSGTGDYYFPDLRSDVVVGKAWFPRRNLVSLVGATWVKSKREYEDLGLSGSLALYLPGAAIEAGGRVNWSDPEAVRTGRAFGAVTLGRDRHRYVTLRGSVGHEGYQLTGEVDTERRFRSQEAGILWREWLSGSLGAVVGVEWYDNPFYTRTGVTLGLFRHW
jgi:YaiO family outer membrane protein